MRLLETSQTGRAPPQWARRGSLVLLRTLQRLHSDLDEHLEGRGDAVDEALVACVQLALPLRATGPVPCESRPASPMLGV